MANHNESSSSSSTSSFCTILWSTQGGRAKACARRTARILRDYQYRYYEQSHAHDHDGTTQPPMSQLLPYILPGSTGYYGSSFDDLGPEEFFKLGSEPCSTTTTTTARSIRQSSSSNNSNSSNSSDNKDMTAEPNSKRRRLVIMFVSTTGDAEQCDSIQNTWKKLLQKNIPSNQFEYLQFAMFCLGDRAYGPMAYCAAGRKLAARLVQLGARPFCKLGYGDDGTPNGGVFYDLDVWLKEVLLSAMFSGWGGWMEQEKEDGEEGIRRLGMMARRHGVPQSPYRVVRKQASNRGKEYHDDEYMLQEWQMQGYQEAYSNFFSSQCPSTAYAYHVQNGIRLGPEDAQGMSQLDHPHLRRKPLLASLVSNDRITANGWTQDTRHIRIHVKTMTKGKTNHHDVMVQQLANGGVGGPEEMDRRHDPAGWLIPYQAGDIATIAPTNPQHVVDRFISCLPPSLRSMAEDPLEISTCLNSATQFRSSFVPWPKHATLRGILTYCADICSLPEREDLRALSEYCNPSHPLGKDQRKKLISLSETSDAALYGDYVLREKRNWADVLFDFDSIQYEQEEEGSKGDRKHVGRDEEFYYTPLTIDRLLMILPPIVPRHFSIASAPSSATDIFRKSKGYTSRNGTFGFELDLCVAVVKGTTRYGREYQGLCSNYLAGLRPSKLYNIRLWIKPGSFGRLPLEVDDSGNLKTPIICIGAGTGVAPLRSIIHEREAVRRIASNSRDTSSEDLELKEKNTLVFGCRKPEMDYYFEKEWKILQDQGTLRLLVAFSQNQKHKVYVQKVLKEADGGILIPRCLLENDGAIYIAGGAKMARAVREEIIECLSKYLPTGEKGAKELLQKLQRRGKFCVEAWN